jgi:hypothetical protein
MDSKDTNQEVSMGVRVLGPKDGEVAGQLGALLGDQEVFAEPGDLVFKPRSQWHTFWNPGDTPTRVLELITPAGLEDLFRELGALGGEFDPAALPALAARYGCQVDFEGTGPILQRHGLRL